VCEHEESIEVFQPRSVKLLFDEVKLCAYGVLCSNIRG